MSYIHVVKLTKGTRMVLAPSFAQHAQAIFCLYRSKESSTLSIPPSYPLENSLFIHIAAYGPTPIFCLLPTHQHIPLQYQASPCPLLSPNHYWSFDVESVTLVITDTLDFPEMGGGIETEHFEAACERPSRPVRFS